MKLIKIINSRSTVKWSLKSKLSLKFISSKILEALRPMCDTSKHVHVY